MPSDESAGLFPSGVSTQPQSLSRPWLKLWSIFGRIGPTPLVGHGLAVSGGWTMPVFRLGQAWDAFRDLEREVDRLLSGMSLTQGIRYGRPYPAVNVYELPEELLITAELPGTRPEELELTVSDGVLTLRGKRVGPEGVPDESFRRQERLRGPWQRQLALPERILEDRLSAEFTNGVLTVRLPKAQSAVPRQIPVTDGTPSTGDRPELPPATTSQGGTVIDVQ